MPLPLPMVTWADDVSVPMISTTASGLLRVVHDLVPSIDQVFRNFGLHLNYQAGKTEIMIMVKGSEAAQVRETLLFEQYGTLELSNGASLRAVTGYQHLGILFAQRAALQAEVSERLRKARNAFKQLSKPLFGNRRLSIALRLSLLESLVLPVLFYGSGTWSLLAPRLYRQIDSTVMRWQRSIANDGYWRPAMTTDEQFRAKWGLPSLSLRLAKHRLLFAMQAAKNAPNALFDVLSREDEIANHTWLNALRHAVRWFVAEQAQHTLKGLQLTPAELFAWLKVLTAETCHWSGGCC